MRLVGFLWALCGAFAPPVSDRQQALLKALGAEGRRLFVFSEIGSEFSTAISILNGPPAALRVSEVDAYMEGFPRTLSWFKAINAQIFYGEFASGEESMETYKAVGRFIALSLLTGHSLKHDLPETLATRLLNDSSDGASATAEEEVFGIITTAFQEVVPSAVLREFLEIADLTLLLSPSLRTTPMPVLLTDRLTAMQLEVAEGEVELTGGLVFKDDVKVYRRTAFIDSLRFLTGNARNLRVIHNHASFKFYGEAFYSRAAYSEYIAAATKQLFSAELGLFEMSPEEPHYYRIKAPRDAANDNYNQALLTSAGRFLGMALMSNQAIGVSLSVSLYANLLGVKLTLEDIQEDEPAYYRSLSFLMTAQANGLEEMVIAIDGTEFPVTLENREELISRKVNSLFPANTGERLDWIRQGFDDVVPISIAKRYLSPVEMKGILIGATTINPDELVDGITWEISEEEKVWFRRMLRSFDQQELHAFLKFATNLPRIPLGGIRTINPPLSVKRAVDGPNKFPTVYHCYNNIFTPLYPSEAEFKAKFTSAILDSNWGLK